MQSGDDVNGRMLRVRPIKWQMTTHRITLNCPKCGREFVAEVALDCPSEWIDRFAKLTVCDQCAGPERGVKRPKPKTKAPPNLRATHPDP